MTEFLHPEYTKHDCSILKGAILPLREVEDFEIYHIERKPFNGENAIQMAADLLGIEIKKHTVYKTTAHTAQKSILGKRPNENPEALKEFETKITQVQMYGGINSYAQKFY